MLITIPVQDGFLQLPHVVAFVAVKHHEGDYYVPTAITVGGTHHAISFAVPEEGDAEENLNGYHFTQEEAVKACEMTVAMITSMLMQQQHAMQLASQGRTEGGIVVAR